MKTLARYMTEALSIKDRDFMFSTRDLIDNKIWTPNENYRKMDSQVISENFYKKYPEDKDYCGTVAGYKVMCQYNLHPAVVFSVFCPGASEDDKIKVVQECIDFLLNEVASTAPGRDNKQLLKKLIK